jgi:hypothetical protein
MDVHIDAGICGFQTAVRAEGLEGMRVRMEATSDCPRVQAVGRSLGGGEGVDALSELRGDGESRIFAGRKECCAGCVVPDGLFKAMQAAAGMALAKDVHITFSEAK